MTVAELIKELKKLPQDYLVIMSSDGEGNKFSPCSQACGPYMYEPDSSWAGEIRDKEEHGDDDEYKENAVVLWPTN